MNLELSRESSTFSKGKVKDIYIAGLGFYSNSKGNLDCYRQSAKNKAPDNCLHLSGEEQIAHCLKQCPGAPGLESAALIGNDTHSKEILKNLLPPNCSQEIDSTSPDTIYDAFQTGGRYLSNHPDSAVFIIHNESDSTALFLLTTEAEESIAKIENVGEGSACIEDFLKRENKYVISNEAILEGLSADHTWARVVDFDQCSTIEYLVELIQSIASKTMLPGSPSSHRGFNLMPVEAMRPWVKAGCHSTRNGALILNKGSDETVIFHLSENNYPLEVERETEVFLLGEDSQESLIESIYLLYELIQKKDFANKDLAYLINCKFNSKGPYRLGIVSGSAQETKDKLIKAAEILKSGMETIDNEKEGIYFATKQSRIEGKLAFILPGLGSAYEGMLQDLYESDQATEDIFNYLDSLAKANSSKSLPSEVIFPGTTGRSPTSEALLKADFAVVAVAISSYAIDSFLKRIGIVPDAYLGMSTGEFANCVLNGYTSIEIAAPLFYNLSISVAGNLPTESKNMVTVNLFAKASIVKQAMNEIGGDIHLIADLGPEHVMVTGEASFVEILIEKLKNSLNVVSHKMPAPILYHTPLIENTFSDEEAKSFSDSIDGSDISIQSWSSSLAGRTPTDKEEMEEVFKNMLRKPIRFRESIESMYESGFRKFAEIGPGSILTSKAKEILAQEKSLVNASNLANQPAVRQLNHLIAKLFCHGENPDLSSLYKESPLKLADLTSDEIAEQPFPKKGDNIEVDEIVSSFFSNLNAMHDATMKASQELLFAYLNNANPITCHLIDKHQNLVMCCVNSPAEIRVEQWLKTSFSDEEKQAIQKLFSNEERKRAYTLGRVAAKEAAVKVLSLEREGLNLRKRDILITNSPQGAPLLSTRVDSVPLVSIAHKKDFACALSMPPTGNFSIGIDVEAIRPIEDSLPEFVLSESEYGFIDSSLADRDLAFLKIWTAKEALFKAFCGKFKNTDFIVEELHPDYAVIRKQGKAFEIVFRTVAGYLIAIAVIDRFSL